MSEETTKPWEMIYQNDQGWTIGYYDEINGEKARPWMAIITTYEVETLCKHWADEVAWIEADEKVWATGGSYEGRAHPYALSRLEFFKRILGDDRVTEILTEVRQRRLEKEQNRQTLMDDVKADVPWEFIDENIGYLVDQVNDIPGIVTIASCGGHPEPTQIQHPEGEWFVSFEIRSHWGMRVLFELVEEWQNEGFADEIDLEIMPDDKGYPIGFLSGHSGVDPDRSAEWLRELQGVCYGATHN